MLTTLLVANRGEIALRLFRTAHEMGLRTVAIHTSGDADAPHVRAAERSVEVSSYLDVDGVVEAARVSGADAVHPGYGFLSERAELASALAEAGITMVGPSAEVMRTMGRKDAAREVAVTAGVPVVPSHDLAQARENSRALAYPVLVKAAAGGGGKGMRVVRRAEDLEEAVAAAQREARSAFGDDTLLVEKYVESGRHVEVQVLADGHGHVVHLFERDCSTQRRHQKVLEEAPAPTISPEQREVLTRSAVALAREVGYTNAGTVEFLLDNSADPSTGEGVYFLEMNTRLQVEHPVTEEVVRIRGERLDLVELQLRVAAGEELGFDQGDVGLHGHAIEARVYAEDSFAGFLPQAGTASHVHWDRQPHLRVDHALFSGQVVSTSYDPMLGKVIAWGRTREEARLTLVRALDRTDIFGLTTNTGFLRALLSGAEFRDATIDTAWLDGHEVTAPDDEGARALAAYVLAPDPERPGPWRPDGWRLGAEPAPTLVQLDRLIAVRPHRLDAVPAGVLGRGDRHGVEHLTVRFDGERHEGAVLVGEHLVEVSHRGQRHVFHRPDPFYDSGPTVGDGSVVAQMPGTVLAVNVTQGQTVDEGDTLGVLEAMKMELALKAPFDGVVDRVEVTVGQQVPLGQLLFEVRAEREGEADD